MQEKEIKREKITMRSVIGNLGYAKAVQKRIKDKYGLVVTERVVYLACSGTSKVRYRDLIRMESELFKKEQKKLLKIK
jgi:hypothetical protein